MTAATSERTLLHRYALGEVPYETLGIPEPRPLRVRSDKLACRGCGGTHWRAQAVYHCQQAEGIPKIAPELPPSVAAVRATTPPPTVATSREVTPRDPLLVQWIATAQIREIERFDRDPAYREMVVEALGPQEYTWASARETLLDALYAYRRDYLWPTGRAAELAL